eukprot:3546268-Amphidinium_carterae.1
MGTSEEPGGSSVANAQKQCALCRGDFLESQLQERRIRSQVLLVCSDCVTAHPKVIPRKLDPSSEQAGEKHRLARDLGRPGGFPRKRGRLL